MDDSIQIAISCKRSSLTYCDLDEQRHTDIPHPLYPVCANTIKVDLDRFSNNTVWSSVLFHDFSTNQIWRNKHRRLKPANAPATQEQLKVMWFRGRMRQMRKISSLKWQEVTGIAPLKVAASYVINEMTLWGTNVSKLLLLRSRCDRRHMLQSRCANARKHTVFVGEVANRLVTKPLKTEKIALYLYTATQHNARHHFFLISLSPTSIQAYNRHRAPLPSWRSICRHIMSNAETRQRLGNVLPIQARERQWKWESETIAKIVRAQEAVH